MSLESRGLLDLLVSVDPPDLLVPLDCLVLLERLVVRYAASGFGLLILNQGAVVYCGPQMHLEISVLVDL